MRGLVTTGCIFLVTWAAPARAECPAPLRLTVVTQTDDDAKYTVTELPEDRSSGVLRFADAAALSVSLQLNNLTPDAKSEAGVSLAQIAALARVDGAVLIADGKASLMLGKSGAPGTIVDLPRVPRSLGEAESLVLAALGYSGLVTGRENGEVLVDAPPRVLRRGVQAIALADSAAKTAVGPNARVAAWLALKDSAGKSGRFQVLLGAPVPCGTKVVFAPR